MCCRYISNQMGVVFVLYTEEKDKGYTLLWCMWGYQEVCLFLPNRHVETQNTFQHFT
jgi:hypothetical protein